MPSPIPIEYGKFYHIYNRGNNQEVIFFNPSSYADFLKLWSKYTSLIADTYAYCLLPNHFHFLVGIKDETIISSPTKKNLSQYFSNLFNAYSRVTNIKNNRCGALFQRPFGRIEVNTDAQLLSLIAYIHRNPQKHGYVEDFRLWSYSSYKTILSSGPTRMKRDQVLDWFEGPVRFQEFHRNYQDKT